jgi:hypothetical protein
MNPKNDQKNDQRPKTKDPRQKKPSITKNKTQTRKPHWSSRGVAESTFGVWSFGVWSFGVLEFWSFGVEGEGGGDARSVALERDPLVFFSRFVSFFFVFGFGFVGLRI